MTRRCTKSAPMARWSKSEYKAHRGAALDRAAKPKASKYRAQRVEVDGITFDSKLEARRYALLKIARSAGYLDFKMQVSYPLEVNGQKVTTYRADFVVTYPDGRVEVEDCKGFKTPVYRLKKKLMKAIHGIEIKEITQ